VRTHRRVFEAGRPRLDYGVTGRTDDRGIYRIATLSPESGWSQYPPRKSPCRCR
jgi:hypothetical protein